MESARDLPLNSPEYLASTLSISARWFTSTASSSPNSHCRGSCQQCRGEVGIHLPVLASSSSSPLKRVSKQPASCRQTHRRPRMVTRSLSTKPGSNTPSPRVHRCRREPDNGSHMPDMPASEINLQALEWMHYHKMLVGSTLAMWSFVHFKRRMLC